jgi:tRNA 2-selenouridine synthase
MCISPVVEVVLEKELRVKRLVNEYGNADRKEFLMAMERITKKLGGQHFKAAKEKLLAGDMASTIDILLTYYDKAYSSGLDRKKNRVKATLQWNGKDVRAFSTELVMLNSYQHLSPSN